MAATQGAQLAWMDRGSLVVQEPAALLLQDGTWRETIPVDEPLRSWLQQRLNAIRLVQDVHHGRLAPDGGQFSRPAEQVP